jgi:DNA polymerase-3 subunit epsilon
MAEREIVLDTETTGFEPNEGDRIVEIGAIELIGHVPTGRTYHQYINPQRSMPADAFGVHGIGPDLLEPPQKPAPGQVILRDKPLFADVAQAFIDFIGDAKLVIHNAAFDMKFLNAELGWVNHWTPSRSRGVGSQDRQHLWMRFAAGLVSIIQTAHCTALCLTVKF